MSVSHSGRTRLSTQLLATVLAVSLAAPASVNAQAPTTKDDEKQKERDGVKPPRKEGERPKGPAQGTAPPQQQQAPRKEDPAPPRKADQAPPRKPDGPPTRNADPDQQPKRNQNQPDDTQKSAPKPAPKAAGEQPPRSDAPVKGTPQPPKDTQAAPPVTRQVVPKDSAPAQAPVRKQAVPDDKPRQGTTAPRPAAPAANSVPTNPLPPSGAPAQMLPPPGVPSQTGQPKQPDLPGGGTKTTAPAPTPPPATAPSQSAAPNGGEKPASGSTAPASAQTKNVVPPAVQAAAIPVTATLQGPQNIAQVKQGRVETVGPAGQKVTTEPGNRTIIKQDNRIIITRNETTVIQNYAPTAVTTTRPGGINETVYRRPDGVRVFSEVDGNGRLLRRYRRDDQGRDVVLLDNRKFYRNLAVGVGIGLGIGVALAIAAPVIALPREKYIVDYERASDDDIYEALTAAPVERLERRYSLEEIRYSEPLRAHVRRVDLDAITFEFGSFEVPTDQISRLERVARAIGRAIERNPAEIFMIEGHTDAVGSDEDNLSLSDRRAEAVARILARDFRIPIENLVTQGYGEQFLKVQTQAAERANRRVAVRRITALLNQDDTN